MNHEKNYNCVVLFSYVIYNKNEIFKRKEKFMANQYDPSLHGGNIYGDGIQTKIKYDFSVNINPLGLPKPVQEALLDSVASWKAYPDPECRELTKKLAQHHKIHRSHIVCGNGAADLIYRFAGWMKGRQALIPVPTFSEYERALGAFGCQVRHWHLREEDGYSVNISQLAEELQEGEILFLCNPNNPTGQAVHREEVEILAETCRKKRGFLALDECFCEFLPKPERYSFTEQLSHYPEVMIFRAFTKSYAMAGLRLGYVLCGDKTLAERLRGSGQPWSVSAPAMTAGMAALDMEENDYLQQARELVEGERQYMKNELTQLGFVVFPSQVNFLLFKDVEEEKHGNLWEGLRGRGILIRDCSNFPGLKPGTGPFLYHYYRIGIGSKENNEQLLKNIREIVRKG